MEVIGTGIVYVGDPVVSGVGIAAVSVATIRKIRIRGVVDAVDQAAYRSTYREIDLNLGRRDE